MKRITRLLITCSVFSVITNYSSLIFSPKESFGQTLFQRTIGGTDNDWGFSIIRTTEGGYALAGVTYSFGAGNGDLYIVKLDANGMLQWQRIVGGTDFEYAWSIIQTVDGGYAVAGATVSFGAGNGDMYIVKLDSSGSIQWNRTVGGTEAEDLLSIVQTRDGGYAGVGLTESFGAGSQDFFIIKFDATGTLKWSRTVGGTGADGATSVVQTMDGGFAVAGGTNSFGAGNFDMYIVKLDSSGSLQWNRTVGGTNEDGARSIIQTIDGGYVAAGWTFSFGVGNNWDDMYIVKLDSGGALQWTKTIGGISFDFAQSMIQTREGGYALAGGTGSFGGPDWYIVKLSESGTLQWSRNFRGANGEYAWGIVQTTEGGYAAVGATNLFGAGRKDIFIVKLDTNGNTCRTTTSPPSQSGTGGITTSPNPTVTSPNPTVTSPSPTVGIGGILTNVCVIGIQPISNEIPALYKLYQNYPNPFNPVTRISFQLPAGDDVKLIIFDALGKKTATLVDEKLTAGTYEVDWDGTAEPSGVYFYQLTAGDYTETRKMVLIK